MASTEQGALMTSVFPQLKYRFEALDGLRGVAAFAVLLYHAGTWVQETWLVRHGYLAVDLFFCLSGFVLASAYGGNLKRGMSFSDFAIKRVIRLWPMILVGVSVGAVFELSKILMGNSSDVVPVSELLVAIVSGIALIPMLWGTSETFGQRIFPLNGPSWSLMFEVCINLLWAAFAPRLNTRILIAIFAVSGASLAYFIIQYNSADLGASAETFWRGWPRVTASFTCGLLAYRLFEAGQFRTVVPVELLATASFWCQHPACQACLMQ